MEMMLAENIRRFRKERSLTQEQLAEVLGVTVGAVYKWEAKLSVPELSLIVELADFFDTSVDVLLGYELKDNRPEVCVRRLKEYRRSKDREGLAEAEKALKKFPHSFELVHESATIYRLFGIENKQEAYLLRARELQEESFLLLSQNTDPEIGEISLYGELAEIELALGRQEKALELLKAHNANGIFSDLIGLALSYSDRDPKNAVRYLSRSLLQNVSSLIQTVSGFVNVYDGRGDFASARAILEWETALLSGLRAEGVPCFPDKVNCAFLVYLAYSCLKTGDTENAERTLRQAKALAGSFDAAPCYDAEGIRFVEQCELASASDDLGTTAAESVKNALREIGNGELNRMWEGIQ